MKTVRVVTTASIKRYYEQILSRNCLISVYQLTFVIVEFKLLEERSNNCLPSSEAF